ncbi:MAG: hypothetical protein ACKOED_13255 [Aestuariivirga sp.]|uniref:hypothetical protein n=1 Tax=Aestuariivirga sp. TaxID=2650926 RepID=UPI0038D23259
MADPKRLMRVARAQAALAGSLELKLLEQERKLAALEANRGELDALLGRHSAIVLSLHEPALHRLAGIEAEIAAVRIVKAGLQREVLMSRGRQKSLAMRALVLDNALARQAEQAQIQESVQGEQTKGSGKQDVME